MSGSFKEALARFKSSVELSPGDIVKVTDRSIAFPASIRTKHEKRWCLILSNNRLCADKFHLTVTVAPLSSNTDLVSYADMVISKSGRNGLEVDSRIILTYVQTIPKSDVLEKIGELSLDDWENVLSKVLSNFDRA